ncbi:MAG TPA: porin family protein [Flavobacterium sp.]|jgi:hypothetical protein
MKRFILSAAAVFICTFATAQSEGTKFGVKAGVQSTSFSGDGEWAGTTGFFVGGLVDIAISGNFHVQPELLYSMEGAEADDDFTDEDYGVSYIRIPIMAKYYVMQGLSLQAGPEVAFKIGTDNEDVDAVIASTDFGIGAGVGYELGMGLMFDLRYNLGLSDIYEGPDESLELKNTGIQLGIGYRF